MNTFIYSDNMVYFQGHINGDFIFTPVIHLVDYRNQWVAVHIDDIFNSWFERGLLRASRNEEVLFDLEFGDNMYFKLIEFVKMLENRIEK